jgi:predicted aspartyl protease
MIQGGVSPRLEPKVALTFLDLVDAPLTLDLTIDTGFAGFLALTADVITHLALPLIGEFPVELADGTESFRPCYEARVQWQNSVRTVRAFDLGPDLLVGINFFWGQRIAIDVIVGGAVTIGPIP